MLFREDSYRISCPMCGDGIAFGSEPSVRERRLFMLTARVGELRGGELNVASLRACIGQMCWMCQMLMIGISSPSDSAELASRIERDIAEIQRDLGIAA